jgi:hypothetical protein
MQAGSEQAEYDQKNARNKKKRADSGARGNRRGDCFHRKGLDRFLL